MAAAENHPSSLRHLDDETVDFARKLQCVSCDRYFNLRQRIPRLLRCRHAICEPCASKTLQNSPDIMCPCGFKTSTTGTSINQLEVDTWVSCLIRFLTPPGVKNDLDDINVPCLLARLRGQVTLEALGSSVKALSLDESRNLGNVGRLASPASQHGTPRTVSAAGDDRPRYRPQDFAACSESKQTGVACITSPTGPAGAAATPNQKNLPPAGVKKPASTTRRRKIKEKPKDGWSFSDDSSDDGHASPAARTPLHRQVRPGAAQTPAVNSHTAPKMDPSMESFAAVLQGLTDQELKAVCVICKKPLGDPSPSKHKVDPNAVVELQCEHVFHHNCIVRYVQDHHNRKYVACRVCEKPNGIEVGAQPLQGKMDVYFLRRPVTKAESLKLWSSQYKVLYDEDGKPHIADSLPGFPETGTICIHYWFEDGVQGPKHPSPGKPYRATNFPRIAFLPYTEEGYKVLCMLRIAFERLLIFKIGYSETEKQHDRVVWAGIQHKTSLSGGEYGYPDPGYLQKVTQQLAAVLVTPDDIPKNPQGAFGLSFRGPQVDGDSRKYVR